MKKIKQLLFTIMFLAGISLTSWATCESQCTEWPDCTISMECGEGVLCVQTSTWIKCGNDKSYCIDACSVIIQD